MEDPPAIRANRDRDWRWIWLVAAAIIVWAIWSRHPLSAYVVIKYENGVELRGFHSGSLKTSLFFKLKLNMDNWVRLQREPPCLSLMIEEQRFVLTPSTEASIADLKSLVGDSGTYEFTREDDKGKATVGITIKFDQSGVDYLEIFGMATRDRREVFLYIEGSDKKLAMPCRGTEALEFFGKPDSKEYFSRG